ILLPPGGVAPGRPARDDRRARRGDGTRLPDGLPDCLAVRAGQGTQVRPPPPARGTLQFTRSPPVPCRSDGSVRVDGSRPPCLAHAALVPGSGEAQAIRRRRLHPAVASELRDGGAGPVASPGGGSRSVRTAPADLPTLLLRLEKETGPS